MKRSRATLSQCRFFFSQRAIVRLTPPDVVGQRPQSRSLPCHRQMPRAYMKSGYCARVYELLASWSLSTGRPRDHVWIKLDQMIPHTTGQRRWLPSVAVSFRLQRRIFSGSFHAECYRCNQSLSAGAHTACSEHAATHQLIPCLLRTGLAGPLSGFSTCLYFISSLTPPSVLCLRCGLWL